MSLEICACSFQQCLLSIGDVELGLIFLFALCAGHTDCVRAVAVISATEFLSAANDSTIRRWQTSGECTHTYHGHSSFVYSLALLPGGDFVSGGEDRTLRVWSGGQCTQTIPHPTESVWAVCALANGDIVTGAR
jgi:phospholipase A-2-activating protein